MFERGRDCLYKMESPCLDAGECSASHTSMPSAVSSAAREWAARESTGKWISSVQLTDPLAVHDVLLDQQALCDPYVVALLDRLDRFRAGVGSAQAVSKRVAWHIVLYHLLGGVGQFGVPPSLRNVAMQPKHVTLDFILVFIQH